MTKMVQVYKRKISIKCYFEGNLLEKNGGIQINATVLPEIFPFFLSFFFVVATIWLFQWEILDDHIKAIDKNEI